MGIGESIARQMTGTGGVQAAKAAYDSAVAMGASVDLLKERFKALAEATDTYQKDLLANTKKMHLVGGRIGLMAAATVTNQYSGTGTIGSGAQMAGSAIGMAFPVVGQLVSAFGSVVLAADSLANAVTKRAHELSGYSSHIQTAEARANVQTMIADMHEAQALGPDMARVITAQNDIWIEIRNDLMPIKKVVVELLADFLEWLRNGLEAAGPVIRSTTTAIGESLRIIVELLQAPIDPMGDHLKKALKLIEELPQKLIDAWKDKDKLPEDIWKELMDNAQKEMLPQPGPDPARGGLGGMNLNLPAFMGL